MKEEYYMKAIQHNTHAERCDVIVKELRSKLSTCNDRVKHKVERDIHYYDRLLKYHLECCSKLFSAFHQLS